MPKIATKTTIDNDNNNQRKNKTPDHTNGNDTKNSTGVGSRAKIDYNMEEIDRFFDVVFHSELAEDENILTWSQNTNTPVYPKDIDTTLDRLEKTRLAKACYFGTSTVARHEDGKLYNRKALFKRLHVVVLDDIGTKVDRDRLPEDLVPNYIIETSENNYQYGFVLEKPIDDYELAEALVHLVYTSGHSDTGGKMPTKVVRMPCGINGKKGDKGDFNVRLVELNDDYWTPEELLDVLDVGVSWADVEQDVSVAKQGKSSRYAGTSLWSPIKPTAASLNGVIDPVLEWLYETDQVINDNGEWVTIVCPWHKDHSDGKVDAGYSPVGRGGAHANCRAFHCFHDHCSDKNSVDFLQHVSMVSGIYAPVIDHVADLVADYAFIAADNAACRLRGVDKPTTIKMEGFKNAHPKKVRVYDQDGKEKLVPEHSLWLTSPSRLTLQGLTHDPAKPERIIEHDGLRYLNTYTAPSWGKGAYDKEDVEMFTQFLEYLIPEDSERDYFTQWLAAKAQKPTFKGAAVLMVAPTQGTGRTTLTDMVTTLFTPNNVSKVTYPQLRAATDAGAFNDWLASDIVTCDEIMTSQQSKFTAYESLKDLFDPRPKHLVINTKYGAQRSATLYTSYLLLTNHIDAIGALGDDRRVYVISNTITPNEPEYFTRLNEWLDTRDAQGNPKWARSVWRWLQTLTPDLAMLHAPAPTTKGKTQMVEVTTNVVDAVVHGIVDYFQGVIPFTDVADIAQQVLEYRLVPDAVVKADTVARLVRNKTLATTIRKRVNGRLCRIRVATATVKEAKRSGVTEEYEAVIKGLINTSLAELYENDMNTIVSLVNKHVDDILS